jgi:hypothetical protein
MELRSVRYVRDPVSTCANSRRLVVKHAALNDGAH